MNNQETNTTPLDKSQEPQQRKLSLRPLHVFMEPDELTPDERLDRIIEILAEAAMSETENEGGA